jgi:hypothetical protein
MARARGPQRLTPALQMFGMMNRFPTLRLVSKNPLVWRGDVVPIEGGRAFTLEVHAVWRSNRLPAVRVLAPSLENEPGRSLPPHTFSDGTLCLYHTDDFRWTDGHFIAETIVPWACEWCYYYELWLSTGDWLGPQYLHGAPKRPPTAGPTPDRADRADHRAA